MDFSLALLFEWSESLQTLPNIIHIGTMSSADYSLQALLRASKKTSPHVCETSPDKSVIFPPYTCQIYYMWLQIVIGLCFVMQTYPHTLALYLISVRQVRLLPPASTSLWTPLLLARRFPLSGLVRDLHPLDYAHAGRTKQEDVSKLAHPLWIVSQMSESSFYFWEGLI